jgi:aspartate 1-decarboxylase
VIVIPYGVYAESELAGHSPIVVLVDESNAIVPQLKGA